MYQPFLNDKSTKFQITTKDDGNCFFMQSEKRKLLPFTGVCDLKGPLNYDVTVLVVAFLMLHHKTQPINVLYLLFITATDWLNLMT